MKKDKKNATNVVVKKNSSNHVPRCWRGAPTPSVNRSFPQKIARPGNPIGRLLALQQLDGVDGTTHNLIRGQYDDAYGNVDPASDIHTDPMEFRDTLMRTGYSHVMEKVQ